LAHQISSLPAGKSLRLFLDQPATIHWSTDGWGTVQDTLACDAGLQCWTMDFPAKSLPAGFLLDFTILWSEGWEGRDFQVKITEKSTKEKSS